MPAAQAALEEHQMRPEDVPGTGPGGRILKEDVLRRVEEGRAAPETKPTDDVTAFPETTQATSANGREEEVIPMSRLRRTVAERLLEAQHNAALLTTFNEIDMGQVMALRKEFGEAFQQKY